MKRVNTRYTEKGFTLLELMIVVAVVGILAAIAYPSYMDSVRKSNRADAKAALNDAAQQMQRCYTLNSSYSGCESNVDRKSTRLNSSHVRISYAVFCLKKKKKQTEKNQEQKRRTPETSSATHM